MDETREMLNGEIESAFNTLKTLSPDTQKYKEVSANLKQLYELKISEDKAEREFEEKEARREMEDKHHTDEVDANFVVRRDENEIKSQQLKDQKREFFINLGVTLLFSGATLFTNWYWMKKTFLFEEHGTIMGKASSEAWKSIFKPIKFK